VPEGKSWARACVIINAIKAFHKLRLAYL